MSFYTKIAKSANEDKGVAPVYNYALAKLFNKQPVFPYKCDGYFEEETTDAALQTDKVRLICEYKKEVDFKNRYEQMSVLLQAIFYIKKFEKKGEILPNVILIGDRNECFIVPTIDVKKYLEKTIDWSVAASQVAVKFPEIVKEMESDESITIHVFNIDAEFSFKTVWDRIQSVASGDVVKVAIDADNIVSIYTYWHDNILLDKDLEDEQKVEFFLNILLDQGNTYLHPKKNNMLMVRGQTLKVKTSAYNGFIKHFKQEYTKKEQEVFTANKDRIMQDVRRRKTGAFYTPDDWAKEAHKMIGDTFGSDWKEKYIVWDCACGTANLTRMEKFKELYLTTLDGDDIATIKQMGYNQEARAIQTFDFLNEEDEVLPSGLRKAIEEGKKILFLINPPYGQGSSLDGNNKNGISDTKIGEKMLKNKLGLPSRNLYAQFIYRIMKYAKKNKNIKLCIFAPPLFMTGQAFDSFREKMYNVFKFEDGMLFQASEFADVKSQWGISFTLWSSK